MYRSIILKHSNTLSEIFKNNFNVNMPPKSRFPDIIPIFTEWIKVNKTIESWRNDSDYWKTILKNLGKGYTKKNKKCIYVIFRLFQKKETNKNAKG